MSSPVRFTVAALCAVAGGIAIAWWAAPRSAILTPVPVGVPGGSASGAAAPAGATQSSSGQAGSAEAPAPDAAATAASEAPERILTVDYAAAHNVDPAAPTIKEGVVVAPPVHETTKAASQARLEREGSNMHLEMIPLGTQP